jgi:hypothetical protein
MQIELDHLFICTSCGAPEAESLVQFGLREGTPNQHPGQGTANRRFPLLHAMIELFWVDDPAEAQSPTARPTQLWERWTQRERGSCPFGICVRPAQGVQDEVPFPAWAYRPSYLPSTQAFHIGEAGLDEPMWIYMGFMQRSGREKHFLENPIGIREITGLILTTPVPLRSKVSQVMIEDGVISTNVGGGHLLEIEFDRARSGQVKDCRPDLPLLFHF